MSDWPPENEILLDSNVFLHMYSRDPNFNGDSHIALFLQILVLSGTRLCVDANDVIRGEYQRVVEPYLEKEWQIGTDLELLRYWMSVDTQEQVEIAIKGELMKKIRTVIHENEGVDRTLVCVSFTRGRPLVSNDELHIVRGSATEAGKLGWRRDRLRGECKKLLVRGAEILYSAEAATKRAS